MTSRATINYTWNDSQNKKTGSGRTVVRFLMLAVTLSHCFGSYAEDTAVQTPQISLTVATEEGEKLVLATLTLKGAPVEDATIAFSVRRSFGFLALGGEQTLDDGTAAVAFPTGLPADTLGKLYFVAEVTAPPPLKGTRGELSLSPEARATLETAPHPRALWSRRAPVPLLLLLLILVGGVWFTYAIVIRELIKIWRGGER